MTPPTRHRRTRVAGVVSAEVEEDQEVIVATEVATGDEDVAAVVVVAVDGDNNANGRAVVLHR